MTLYQKEAFMTRNLQSMKHVVYIKKTDSEPTDTLSQRVLNTTYITIAKVMLERRILTSKFCYQFKSYNT